MLQRFQLSLNRFHGATRVLDTLYRGVRYEREKGKSLGSAFVSGQNGKYSEPDRLPI